MISSPGACSRFMLLFLGRSPLHLWLSITLALLKRHLLCTGGRVAWCKGLKPPLCALYHLLKSVYTDGRGEKNGIGPPSPPEWGVHNHHFSGGPHRKGNNFPSCIPGFCQIPALTMSVWATCIPRSTVFLCFTLGAPLVFKTPNFTDLVWYGNLLIL